jgi:hypothetical protein
MKQNATHYETHPDYAQAQVNGMPEAMTVAPRSTASTPLKLPDYTPTFASLAHTPEQLMEIKRMNEEAEHMLRVAHQGRPREVHAVQFKR